MISCIQVENGHQASGDILKDYCDGTTYRHHPLFVSDPKALQIIFYYDDLEVCNPLGDTNYHSYITISFTCNFVTGIFYYILGNVRPQFRSSLKSIQLVSVMKASYIQKHGMNAILQPFMDDIKLLERVWSTE